MYNSDTKKVFMILIAAFALYWLYSSFQSGELFTTLLMLPGLILAITIHEYSHAKMADKLGDPTPEAQGRVTLNPLAHVDPVGMICLLVAGFGWGKPVQIDPSRMRSPAKDSMLVALAGPVSNFILAFISFLAYGILYFALPHESTLSLILLTMVYVCAQINLSLGVFNLLPFPPLDGSKILVYFLKGKAKTFIWNLERYSYIILAILYFTELPSVLITPVIQWIATFMINIVEKILELFI